ncbi:MAG: hypothetical protein PHV11_01160 [Candidatus Bipolaricaulis sp.]|nr:hypothetical protein [Candidatus Bipolaricaulis sp.]
MDRKGFQAYLASRRADEVTVARSFALAERFESYVEKTLGASVARATTSVARGFADELMRSRDNAFDDFLAVARYARFAGNLDAFRVMLEIIDGHEAFANLSRKIAEEFGDAVRARVFADIEIPALGVLNLERARRMSTVIDRLQSAVGRDRCAHLLGQGLRDLPDAGYESERERYMAADGVDEYLRRKGDEFIVELHRIKNEGSLYYTQPITDEVIAFVESHPEIRQGVRAGNVVYEAKIPYMTVEYLAETDPLRRAYSYCHCPWARESLRSGEKKVSGTFCNCSAAFHKKPYDVIFGKPIRAEVVETVLDGDPWCRFAIYLPDDVT